MYIAKNLCAVVAVALALTTPTATSANTVNRIGVIENTNSYGRRCRGFEEHVETSSGYIGHLTTGEDPEQTGQNCSYYVEASAGAGLVAVNNIANASDLATQGYTTFFEGRMIELHANASTLTPFLFDVPEDYDSDLIAIRPNLLLNAAATARNRDGDSNAFSSLYWSMEFFQDENDPLELRQGFLRAVDGANTTNSIFGDRLDNYDPVLTGFIADVNRPLFMRLTLESTVRIRNSGASDESFAAINAGNTFSFNPDLPAFDLPDGVTVTAPGANVFNNVWSDVRAPNDPAPSPVPLPAGLPLLLAALGSFAWIRRNR